MKSIFSLTLAVLAGLVGTTGNAYALAVPEPGSMALVGVALVGAILFAKRKK